MKIEQIRMTLSVVLFWCAGVSCGIILGRLSVGYTSMLPQLGWFFIGVGALMLANAVMNQNEKEGYILKLVKKNEK